jgi:hypothetical protein
MAAARYPAITSAACGSVMGVASSLSTTPGETVVTRMPGSDSWRRPSVNAQAAYFGAEYTAQVGTTWCAPTEAMVTTWPPSRRRKCGRAAATPYIRPRTSTSSICSHWSTSRDSRRDRSITPALATRTSSRPCAATTSSTRAVTAARSVTSSARASLWDRHEARGKRSEVERFRHPVVGELVLSMEAFDVRSAPGQQLVVYQADPGTPGAAAPARLRDLVRRDPGTSTSGPGPRGGAGVSG